MSATHTLGTIAFMNGKFNLIEDHAFIETLKSDANKHLSNKEFNIFDTHIPESTTLDEFEYYVHNVGFYATHFLTWLNQLNLGVELLRNFEYKKDVDYNRIDHLRFNLENYVIRFQSIGDKLLQLINSTFHLTISENCVNHNTVMTNLKVARTDVPNKFKPIKSYLKKLYNERNVIIHRHSHLDKELRKLELFYLESRTDEDLRFFRTQKLKSYLDSKTEEYNEHNQKILSLVSELFDALLIQYTAQKGRLFKITKQ